MSHKDTSWQPRRARKALVELLYRAPVLRRILEPIVPQSVVGRIGPLVLLRGYRDFNGGLSVPHGNFVDDFRLVQAAEMLGSVGTFNGPGALDQVLSELYEAFDDVRFEPQTARWLDQTHLLVVVRFQGTGRGSGVRVDRDIAHLWTNRGLRTRSLAVYWDPAEAFETVGVSE